MKMAVKLAFETLAKQALELIEGGDSADHACALVTSVNSPIGTEALMSYLGTNYASKLAGTAI